jgi:phosphomannomutase
VTPYDRRGLLAAAQAWLAEDPDPAARAALKATIDGAQRGDAGALAELQDAFGQRLEFGTAGLRGVLGPGPNRMNRALVRRVTAGLARYLLRVAAADAPRGVVVGYDGRRLSRELAEDTARVLAGAGIPVLAFTEYAPTPLVAFAVKHLRTAAGVVVTASHNPPEYNGFKVYWSNGAQIIPPHDQGISAAIESVQGLAEVPLAGLDDARRAGLIRPVPAQLISDYLDAIAALRRHPEVPRALTVVYTPMHGVGGKLVRAALDRDGVARLSVVPQQAEPDGEFPTVRFPNPEEKGAMDLALALAAQVRADLVLANDPDADRLAVAVPQDGAQDGARDGNRGGSTAGGPASVPGAVAGRSSAAAMPAAAAPRYRMLTGDQIGTVLGYYLLTERLGAALPAGAKPLVMTTIVSSRLLSKMARELGARYDETLTGFKWIANRAQQLAAREDARLLLGYEEALGYSVGEVTPDKDGIGAALMFVELAAVCRQRGLSVLQYLESIYRRFGLFLTRQHSVTLPGAMGSSRIAAIMESFRAHTPQRIGADRAVVQVADYSLGTLRTLSPGASGSRAVQGGMGAAAGAPARLELPRSNVIALTLAGGASVLLRPSGTEPKIKYYFELSEAIAAGEPLSAALARAQRELDGLVSDFLRTLDELVPG